ncbi:glycosyltransferase [Photobacterium leiognathi]|uniref:glycosyltransferase n=1 Tax=Photobacterium leiognathi TaxID=553611 RepID=UPI00298125D4|nr:glycosyltransferase [Photobacterium leiognathi]
MNICFFSSDMGFKGGAEKFSLSLSNELDQIGYSCFYLSIYSTEYVDKKHTILFNEKLKQREMLLKSIKRIAKYIDENEIDVFICIGHGLGLMANLGEIISKRDCKVVFHSHSPFNECIGIASKISLFSNYLFKNNIITLTERDKKNYEHYTNNRCNIKTIRNFVDRKFNNHINNNNEFISVGSLCERKNFIELIDIFNDYLEFNPNAKLNIYGEGEEKDKIEIKIASLNLQNNIFLKGFCNADEIYTSGSCLLMTSKAEGLPLCILEAFSFGIPCIAYDCETGPKELIVDKTGEVITMHDKASFVNAMINISNNVDIKQIEEHYKNYSKDLILSIWDAYFKSLKS